MICIWDWPDAPSKYRQLSENGGDENRVMLIPWVDDVTRSIHFTSEDSEVSFKLYRACSQFLSPLKRASVLG